MNIEPIPGDCLPPDDVIEQLLRGPKIGADGKIEGDGPWAGKTPGEILAERDAYNRACGD